MAPRAGRGEPPRQPGARQLLRGASGGKLPTDSTRRDVRASRAARAALRPRSLCAVRAPCGAASDDRRAARRVASARATCCARRAAAGAPTGEREAARGRSSAPASPACRRRGTSRAAGMTRLVVLELEDAPAAPRARATHRGDALSVGRALRRRCRAPESRAVPRCSRAGRDRGHRPPTAGRSYDERCSAARPRSGSSARPLARRALPRAAPARRPRAARGVSPRDRSLSRDWRDADGRRAFAIPEPLAPRRREVAALDRLSMARVALDERASPRRALRWWVEYACRDDYGAIAPSDVGVGRLHYFACARSPTRARRRVLTWPEGNGWLVPAREPAGRPRSARCARQHVRSRAARPYDAYDSARDRTTRVLARRWCSPPAALPRRSPAPPTADACRRSARFAYAPGWSPT